MKKLFLILLLIFIPLCAFTQETVVIDTPYDREISLDIPQDKDAIVDLLVEVSGLYWAERYDFKSYSKIKDSNEIKLLNQIDYLKIGLTDSNKVIVDLNEQIMLTEKLLDQKLKPTPVSLGVSVGTGIVLSDPITFTVTGTPYMLFFDVFTLGLTVGYPLQVGINLGILF